jgi:hypothetical protein
MPSRSRTTMPPESGPLTALPNCVTCHRRPARARGNCQRCWCRHAAAVRRGQTTWAELEQQGLARPPQPRGTGWRKAFPFGSAKPGPQGSAGSNG